MGCVQASRDYDLMCEQALRDLELERTGCPQALEAVSEKMELIRAAKESGDRFQIHSALITHTTSQKKRLPPS